MRTSEQQSTQKPDEVLQTSSKILLPLSTFDETLLKFIEIYTWCNSRKKHWTSLEVILLQDFEHAKMLMPPVAGISSRRRLRQLLAPASRGGLRGAEA